MKEFIERTIMCSILVRALIGQAAFGQNADSSSVSQPSAKGSEIIAPVDGPKVELNGAQRKAALAAWKQQQADQAKARARASAAATKAASLEDLRRRKISSALLEKYDRNKNGRLEPEEWDKHRLDLDRQAEERSKAQASQQP